MCALPPDEGQAKRSKIARILILGSYCKQRDASVEQIVKAAETATGTASEALSVADKAIIADASVPLPKHPRGLGVRFVEATFGRDYQGYFRNFLVTGGIMGLFDNSGLPITIMHRSMFCHNCREVVMVSSK